MATPTRTLDSPICLRLIDHCEGAGQAGGVPPRKSVRPKRALPQILTHLDGAGQAHMVDVGPKPETLREAVASAIVKMTAATLRLVQRGEGRKGDVLGTARIAALSAIKRTADLIPLCHPVRVVGSDVRLSVVPRMPGIRIVVTVRAFDRTGVEMEAMVGAAAAALTIYDMVKGVQRDVQIAEIQLEEKRGGKSGVWLRSR